MPEANGEAKSIHERILGPWVQSKFMFELFSKLQGFPDKKLISIISLAMRLALEPFDMLPVLLQQ